MSCYASYMSIYVQIIPTSIYAPTIPKTSGTACHSACGYISPSQGVAVLSRGIRCPRPKRLRVRFRLHAHATPARDIVLYCRFLAQHRRASNNRVTQHPHARFIQLLGVRSDPGLNSGQRSRASSSDRAFRGCVIRGERFYQIGVGRVLRGLGHAAVAGFSGNHQHNSRGCKQSLGAA